jgi:arginyl-tRNA synthetase
MLLHCYNMGMHVAGGIKGGLGRALSELGINDAKIALEHPAQLEHGDYASGVALAYAKQAGIAPRKLAEKIVEKLGAVEGVSKIDIAGPGFINFTLAPSALASVLEEARSHDSWGSNDHLKSEVVLIEYTSPNLFKPLHIGNLVGNILGESLSRLMQFSGADMKRINYPSDIGLTVAKGVWGLRKIDGNPTSIDVLGEAYRTGNEAYENDAEAKEEIESINKKLYENSDPELSSLRTAGIEISRRHLDEICKRLGTSFDLEIFESEAGPLGYDLVQAHLEDDIFEKSDGAIVFKGEKEGLHTRVFVNSVDLPTYEAKDLGNFELKRRAFTNWTQSYVVTGVEQREYFKVVIAAIRHVFPETVDKVIRHIPTGFLTLTTGKMSSRKGNVLTGEALLADLAQSAKERAAESRAENHEQLAEQIAVGAIKYQILKQSSGRDIVFDRERALSLEGDSGPYLQYAYARTCAIIERANSEGVESKLGESSEPNELMRLLVRFPEVVERAAQELEPHYVANYLLEIAAAFNSWYAQVHILDGTPEAAHKVAVVEAVNRVLKNGLWILGIPAPNKM